MTAPTLNRFEWFKAVMQVEGLSATTKNVAGALAIQFANDETGQINPSQETVADYLKVHKDTVKRALRELRNAGWLQSLGDGGRGKARMMRLLSPSKIVPFRLTKEGQNTPRNTRERGAEMHPQTAKRGDDLQQKGGENIPPHYKEEQYKEQKGRDPRKTRWNSHRFIGNPWDGFRPIKSDNRDALTEWGRWLKSQDLPALYSLPLQATDEKSGSKFFFLPWLNPPEDERKEAEALAFFADILEPNEVRYAAE